MKRRVFLFLIFSVMLFACAREEDRKNGFGNVTGASVGGVTTESAVSGKAIGRANKPDSAETVILEHGNKPMLSEKVDLTRKGVELVYMTEHATSPIKGDDGNCYYFRYQRKGRRVTFYKNNAVKVCETVLPEKYKKNVWFIAAFLKQGEQFWVKFISDEENEKYLVPLQIKDGKWGDGIEVDGQRIIYYKDCFYSFDENMYGGTVEITDKEGNKKSIQLEKKENKATLETIIDDKLYYTAKDRISVYRTVMRCNLDGSDKEELFRYKGVPRGEMNCCKLMLDEEFFYFFDSYCGFTLTRIPLYGGEVEEIVATDWYDLSEDSIFYLDGKGHISRVDKKRKGRPETVMSLDEDRMGVIPFLCAEGHLLVEVHNENKEERNILETLWRAESYKMDYDIDMNYFNECYWVTENGKVEDTIPGSGISKKYREWYQYLQEFADVDEEGGEQ